MEIAVKLRSLEAEIQSGFLKSTRNIGGNCSLPLEHNAKRQLGWCCREDGSVLPGKVCQNHHSTITSTFILVLLVVLVPLVPFAYLSWFWSSQQQQ